MFLLFIMAIIFGSPEMTPKIGEVDLDYPAHQAGIEEGDFSIKK